MTCESASMHLILTSHTPVIPYLKLQAFLCWGLILNGEGGRIHFYRKVVPPKEVLAKLEKRDTSKQRK